MNDYRFSLFHQNHFLLSTAQNFDFPLFPVLLHPEVPAYLEKEPLIGENVYVFRSEYPEQIMKWNKNGSSTGEYLLGILENRIPEQEKNGVTLRQVYQQNYENNTLPDIPEIILQDEEIQVCLE